MKTHPRLLSCAVTALALLTLTTGCPDKLKNLKAKAEECERELKSINSETDKIQTKIDKVAAWERLSPPPATAIAIQRTEIEREQR